MDKDTAFAWLANQRDYSEQDARQALNGARMSGRYLLAHDLVVYGTAEAYRQRGELRASEFKAFPLPLSMEEIARYITGDWPMPVPEPPDADGALDAKVEAELLRNLRRVLDEFTAAAVLPENRTARFTPDGGATYCNVTPAQRATLMAIAPPRIREINEASPDGAFIQLDPELGFIAAGKPAAGGTLPEHLLQTAMTPVEVTAELTRLGYTDDEAEEALAHALAERRYALRDHVLVYGQFGEDGYELYEAVPAQPWRSNTKRMSASEVFEYLTSGDRGYRGANVRYALAAAQEKGHCDLGSHRIVRDAGLYRVEKLAAAPVLDTPGVTDSELDGGIRYKGGPMAERLIELGCTQGAARALVTVARAQGSAVLTGQLAGYVLAYTRAEDVFGIQNPVKPDSYPPPVTDELAQVLAAVELVDRWLDETASPEYRDNPLANQWRRLSAGPVMEAAEITEALNLSTGGNQRKGRVKTMDDALAEAADTAFSALLAIQSQTKNVSLTWGIFSQAMAKARSRVPEEMRNAPPPGAPTACPSCGSEDPAVAYWISSGTCTSDWHTTSAKAPGEH